MIRVMFTGQHDIRRVSETSVSLFDNGQYTVPPIARALEYSLDETNKIATLVWDYVYDSAIYSVACGNHQTIENGNHLVDLGFTNSAGTPWMAVVKPDKTKVLEVSMPNGFISYRAFNYINLPWELHRPAVDCQKIGENYFLVAEQGHPGYAWSTGDTTSSIQITDAGEYWVFVPYGAGYISSEHITITDITNPCLFTGEQQQTSPVRAGLSCMPNPASDRVRISFQLPENSDVTISLTTLQGTEILRPVQGYYTAGTHESTINISSFTSGMYFLTLSSVHNRIVKRLIKL